MVERCHPRHAHNFNTVFRNHFTGFETNKTDDTIPMQLSSHARYHNAIGNILGTTGFHNTYQAAVPTSTNCFRSIYTLGWSSTGCSAAGGVLNDTLVAATLMRWGNCDAVTGFSTAACVFNAAEVPSGLALFANAVPGSHALPPSFYTAQPTAWWGTPWATPPWPPMGPDVTGGNVAGVGGLAYKTPARLCYENTAADSATYGSLSPVPLAFNAASCYAAGSPTPPAAPTGFGVR